MADEERVQQLDYARLERNVQAGPVAIFFREAAGCLGVLTLTGVAAFVFIVVVVSLLIYFA